MKISLFNNNKRTSQIQYSVISLEPWIVQILILYLTNWSTTDIEARLSNSLSSIVEISLKVYNRVWGSVLLFIIDIACLYIDKICLFADDTSIIWNNRDFIEPFLMIQSLSDYGALTFLKLNFCNIKVYCNLLHLL